jgi:hypothetical protein
MAALAAYKRPRLSHRPRIQSGGTTLESGSTSASIGLIGYWITLVEDSSRQSPKERTFCAHSTDKVCHIKRKLRLPQLVSRRINCTATASSARSCRRESPLARGGENRASIRLVRLIGSIFVLCASTQDGADQPAIIRHRTIDYDTAAASIVVA